MSFSPDTFTTSVDRIKTTNSVAVTPTTKAGGLRALQRGLEDVGTIASQIAGDKSEKEQEQAELNALALDDEEIKAEALRIGSNPNEVAGSPHAANVHRNVITERNATIIGTALTQEIRENYGMFSDTEATDERILEVRDKLMGNTPKELQGRAAASFDKTMRAVQNMSAEAQVARIRNEQEGAIGVAIVSKLDLAQELGSAVAETPEEIQAFYGHALDDTRDWKDAQMAMSLPLERIEAGITEGVRGWLLRNPDAAEPVIAELLDPDDPIITDPAMVTALGQAQKTADAAVLKNGKDDRQAAKDLREDNQREAELIHFEAGKDNRPMSQDEYNEAYTLWPEGTVKYARATSDRIFANRMHVPNQKLDDEMEHYMMYHPVLSEIVPHLQRLADNGEIGYDLVSAARQHVQQRTRGQIYGPRGAALRSEALMEAEMAQNTNFDEIQTGHGLQRHRMAVMQMVRDFPEVENNPQLFAEKIIPVEAATRSLLAATMKKIEDDAEAHKDGRVPLPELQTDVFERRASLKSHLTIREDPTSTPLERVTAQEEYAKEFPAYEDLWDEMNAREAAEERRKAGRITFSQAPMEYIWGQQKLPDVTEFLLGVFPDVEVSRVRREKRAAAARGEDPEDFERHQTLAPEI